MFDAYVICTSPRSGSTLLCGLLAATGVAGAPESWFHRPSVSEWLDDLELEFDGSTPKQDLQTLFDTIVARGSTANGVFGLRLQRHSFDFFTSQLALLKSEHVTDVQRFRAAFGKTAFIHLTRLDKVQQAVSLVIAEQTGLWHRAADGSELERLSAPQVACYDEDRINAAVRLLLVYDQQWQSWFLSQGITPMRVTYESLSVRPDANLREILHGLGLDARSAKGVEPSVSKLADSVSQDWVAHFRKSTI